MKYSKIILITNLIILFTITGSAFAQDDDKHYTIGFLIWFSTEPFKAEMTELGYIEGENITYMIPSFENVAMEDFFASFNQQVQAMADANVDLFVTNTDTDAMNIQSMTGDTPVVFARSDDPVATGAVADLINPGGHITGIVTNRPHERRLQILTEVNPATDKIYYLYSPLTLEGETVLQQVKVVAEELGVEVVAAQTPDAVTGVEALANVPEGTDWLFLTPFVPYAPEFFEALGTASVTHNAGISWVTNDAAPNYLVSYGPDIAATDAQAAQMVDRILRGASPADLPVQIAENYLTVNLQAAEAIGLEVPVGILRQADLIVRPGYFDDPANASMFGGG